MRLEKPFKITEIVVGKPFKTCVFLSICTIGRKYAIFGGG